MEDIDRIEVIRGSGASLWGANAVNGVINIITKKAKNTQGLLVSAYGGNMRAGGGLRYGADLGKESYLKVFGRYSEYDQSTRIGDGSKPGDNSQLRKLGFQFDKNFGQTDKITLQGDALAGDSGGAGQWIPRVSGFQTPVLAPPYGRQVETDLELSSNYLMGRWQHLFGHGSSTVLRGFWNRNKRESEILNVGYEIHTVDIDFQHNLLLNERQQWVWGLGTRLNFNQTQNNVALGWFPQARQDEIYNFFAQDEITLVPGLWKLTLGSKLEHNPVTEFEWQPNIRLAWTPSVRHSVWGALSRSVRTPSWAEQDLAYNPNIVLPLGGGPASPYNPVTLFSLDGNKQMASENMLAYELGWRGELSPTLTADLALYYYDYNNLCSFAPTFLDMSHIANAYVVQHMAFKNFGEASIWGGEASVAWQLADDWKLRASYTHTAQQYQTSGTAPSGTVMLFQNSFPKNQAMLWSMYQISPQLNFDLNWRFVDGLVVEPDTISSYHELDARLAWKLGHGIELALVGRNLLNKQHMEFGSFIFSVPTPVQREVYATLRWDF